MAKKGKVRKLTKKEVKIIKEYFDENMMADSLAARGHISTLMKLADLIGEESYSVVQSNLKQCIGFEHC